VRRWNLLWGHDIFASNSSSAALWISSFAKGRPTVYCPLFMLCSPDGSKKTKPVGVRPPHGFH
jgi:hypothetical protein